MSNKGCTLFEDSRKGVDPRLGGDCSRALYTSREALWCTLFEGRETLWCTLFEGREALWCTLFEGRIVGRGVSHRLIKGLIISKEYIFIGMRPFGETKSKSTRVCSKWTISYHYGGSVIPKKIVILWMQILLIQMVTSINH